MAFPHLLQPLRRNQAQILRRQSIRTYAHRSALSFLLDLHPCRQEISYDPQYSQTMENNGRKSSRDFSQIFSYRPRQRIHRHINNYCILRRTRHRSRIYYSLFVILEQHCRTPQSNTLRYGQTHDDPISSTYTFLGRSH